MNIRSAFILTTLFALSVFVVPFGNSQTPNNPNRQSSISGVAEQPSLWRSALPITTTTVPTTTTTTTSPPAPPTIASEPPDYQEWTRVATCEEGGWVGYAGPAYPDSLGISATNWAAYGGTSDLSPDAQIVVADRIEAAAGTAGYVPDQYGCAAW